VIRRRFYDLGTAMATLQIDAGKPASSTLGRKRWLTISRYLSFIA
jgi:hypothetical protein